MKRFMELAIRCCRDEPEERPRMLEIVRELENLFTKEEKPYSSPSSSASGMPLIIIIHSRNSQLTNSSVASSPPSHPANLSFFIVCSFYVCSLLPV